MKDVRAEPRPQEAQDQEVSLRSRLTVAAGVLVVWWLLIGVFVGGFFDRAPWDVRPFHSDEYKNWSAVQTFERAGLGGGQYSVSEVDSRSNLSRFGPHGPVYPALYGSLARLFGWRDSGALFFNTLLLAAGLLAFFSLAPLRRIELWIAAAVLATSSMVALTLPLTMQETLHQSLALLFAGLFLRFRISDRAETGFVRLASFGAVLLAMAVRPTWAGACAALLLVGPLRDLRRSLQLLVVAMAVALSFSFFLSMEPMIESSPLQSTASASEHAGIGAALGEALDSSWTKATAFARGKEPLYHASQRLSLAVLLIAIVVVLGRASWRPPVEEAFFHLANLGFPLAANVAIANFGGGRDLRLFAPHVLLSLLVCARGRLGVLALLGVTLNLVWLSDFPRHLRAALEGPYSELAPATLALRSTLPSAVTYRPGLDKWCNTVLAVGNQAELRAIFLAAPPGIGVSVYAPRSAELLQPRSAFVLVGPSVTELPFGEDFVQSESLGGFRLMTQRRTACPASRASE